jgi:hypothetical protein
VAAAAAEAATRDGINKVFLDIAHRSQLVVYRQLELLDVAEAKQGDPEHLELLFHLDHLATRARRNAENLLILGGGQPGRKWRRPAALEDVVRSSVSETEQFARVDTVRLPDVHVQGSVVGDLIHLLAELVDNATAFSPPDSVVTVRGNVAGRGVVIEVEDQGLGIERVQREWLNDTLRNPPGFQVMALSGQWHLGLFVVGHLAQRHGIVVSLQDSAYGGIKAVVLIPMDAVELEAAADHSSPALGRTGRHEQLAAAPVQIARDMTPRAAGGNGTGPLGRAVGMAPGDGARASRTLAPASAVPPWEIGAPAPGAPRRARPQLPHRERLANLVPELHPDAEATTGRAAPRRPQRGPEEARGAMSAFQRGTRRGRDIPSEDN